MAGNSHPEVSRPVTRFSSKLYLFLLLAAAASLLAPATPVRAGVSVQVTGGVLTALLTGGETLEISCVSGLVYVNNLAPDSGSAGCSTIVGVVINGSAQADLVDLRQLSVANFPSLGSVSVNAAGGNDIIYASELSEVLDGGAGDDTYIGTDKNDLVNTSQGLDFFLEATLPLGLVDSPAAQAPTGDLQTPAAPGLEASSEAIDFNADAVLNGTYQIPPDPIGAAGPSHVLSVVNSAVQWFTKGGTLQKSQSLSSFFTSLSPANALFDPKAIFDQYAGRFLVVALERQVLPSNGSRILLAVSDDSDPNGAWYFHAINSKLVINGTDTWADYPGFAIDEEAVYISANMFTFGAGQFQGSRLWITAKAPFYSGGAASASVYDPSTAAGVPATTMQPAHVFGTAASGVGTWLVRNGFSALGEEYLSIIRVDNPLGIPAFTHHYVLMGDIENTSAGFSDAPQNGTAMAVETNDRRALHAVWRDDSLWATFQILPESGSDAGQVTAHWVRVGTSNLSAPTLLDQGSAGGEEIAAGTHTFFPSIAVDQCGNMALGFAASAPSIYPGAYYSTRYASDPPGSLQPSAALAAGMDYYYRAFGTGRNRWGDYSGIALDPAGEATFWVYNEYALTRGTVLPAYPAEDGRWGTRWGSFLSGIDFGDLPAGYAQTLNGENGARHCLSSLALGASADPDPDGQASATAQGDSDNGVLATGNWSDGSGDLLVEVSGGRACLSAWLDYWDGTTFGADNDFADVGEQIFDRQALEAGTTPLSFTLPPNAASGTPSPAFFARFRLVPDLDSDGDCTDQAALSLTGLAAGGEVEDYRFTFSPTAVRVEKFQASAASIGSSSWAVAAIWVGIVCLLGFSMFRYRVMKRGRPG